MLKGLQTVLSATPLVALPAIAADSNLPQGINDVSPATFCFVVAFTLIAACLFRAAAGRLLNAAARKIGFLYIRSALQRSGCKTLHDFILPGAYGGLVKIDHAALTPAGILCIQVKHVSGRIHGDKNDAQWTVSDGVRRRRFLNPLIQNEGRRRALQKIAPGIPVINLVVFQGRVTFAPRVARNVIRLRRLGKYIDACFATARTASAEDNVWTRVRDAALMDDAIRRDFQAQIGFT